MSEFIGTRTYTRSRAYVASNSLITPWKNQRSVSARDKLDSLNILYDLTFMHVGNMREVLLVGVHLNLLYFLEIWEEPT